MASSPSIVSDSPSASQHDVSQNEFVVRAVVTGRDLGGAPVVTRRDSTGVGCGTRRMRTKNRIQSGKKSTADNKREDGLSACRLTLTPPERRLSLK